MLDETLPKQGSTKCNKVQKMVPWQLSNAKRNSKTPCVLGCHARWVAENGGRGRHAWGSDDMWKRMDTC